MDAERRDTQRAAGRRKGPWSQAELEKLRRKYGKVPDGVLARELNRSVESVRRIAKKVFKGDPRTGPWAPSEIQGLKEYWGAADLAVIELVLRRDAKDILRKVDELRGSLASGEWTAEDIQALKRHYGTRTDEDLVVILPLHHAHHPRDLALVVELCGRQHRAEVLAQQVDVRVLVLGRDHRLDVALPRLRREHRLLVGGLELLRVGDRELHLARQRAPPRA